MACSSTIFLRSVERIEDSDLKIYSQCEIFSRMSNKENCSVVIIQDMLLYVRLVKVEERILNKNIELFPAGWTKEEKVFQGKTDEGLLLLIRATRKQMFAGWDCYWFTVQIILNGFPLLNKYIKLRSKQNIVVWFVCRESSNRVATPSMTQLGSEDQESILSFPWTVDCCFHPLPRDILRPLVLFVTHGPSRQNFPFLLTTKFSYGQSIMKASINLLKRWCLSFLPDIQYNILKRSK